PAAPAGIRVQNARRVGSDLPWAPASTLASAGVRLIKMGRRSTRVAGTFGTVAAQRSFTWDPSGQMLSYSEGGALVASYRQDAFGRRVAIVPSSGSPTYFFYGSGEGSHPEAEYNGTWQTNVLAGGAVIATVDASGNVSYLAADMLGTTRQTELNLTSASGATRFFPYGEEQNAVSAEYL